ncbi:hypothetical protein QPK60_16635, partial [Aeromonas caviae]
APEYPLARTATGIVKWNSDPGRQRLSADNEAICTLIAAGEQIIGIVKWRSAHPVTAIVG